MADRSSNRLEVEIGGELGADVEAALSKAMAVRAQLSPDFQLQSA